MTCPNCKADTDIILFTTSGRRCRLCKGKVRTGPMPPPPMWLGKAIAVAQHQDVLNSWPLWKRVLHRLLVSRWCPCCVEWKKRKNYKMKLM